MSPISSDQPAATTDHEAPTVAATAAVTVEQAATILGVSVSTVKRRIRSGALRAEEARRPQGTVWLVSLPTAATTDQSAAGSGHNAAATVAAAPTTTPQAEAMVSLIQTTIGAILGPLVVQLDAQRQTVERQADALRVLERENGRLSAELQRAASGMVALGDELEAVKARYSPVAPDLTPRPLEPKSDTQPTILRRFQAWSLLLLVIVIAAVSLIAGTCRMVT